MNQDLEQNEPRPLGSKRFYTRELAGVPLYQWGSWLISVALIATFAYLGIELPALPAPPVPYALGERGTTNLDVLALGGELQVIQPAAATTATPAALIDSSAAGAKLLEVRDAATPVFSILNGGALSRTGNDSVTGNLNVTGAGKVAAPTAVATATPALVVDSAGVSNLLEVRDAATPVFTVRNGGAVVGNVLQYGSSGQKGVAATASITTTGTVAHGLATVTWAVCTLAQDPHTDAGDAATVSVSIAGNTVTAKAWQDDATAATETEVDVNCWVVGTP